jgi:acetyl-CoA carboxylase biotin carboxyl carrier protein
MKLDKEKLKEFIKFMDENGLSELEIEEEGKRIRLKRGPSGEPVIVSQGTQASNKEKEVKDENIVEIKSPMVGTFYRAASPGATPYVDIGKVIKPGDVVCIIEAMKLMNEIKAEVGGKITKISVENGEPIEFGQTLFVIEPS